MDFFFLPCLNDVFFICIVWFFFCDQSADVCEQILRVVSRSSRLEELVLDNAGLKT